MRLLTQRKERPTGEAGRATSAEHGAARPDTGHVGALQETLDRSPGVQDQLRLRRTLQRAGPGAAVVQRKVLWGQGVDRKAFGGVESDPLYRRLDESPARVYVTSAEGETAVTVVKTRNADEIETLLGKGGASAASTLDYIVNIDPATIAASGTKVEANRAFAPARGGIDISNLVFDPTLLGTYAVLKPQAEEDPLERLYATIPGLREIEEQRDPYARGIFSQRVLPRQPSLAELLYDTSTGPDRPRGFTAANTEGMLSLSTVLLHEFGHIVQNLRTPRRYKGPPRLDAEVTDVPPLPDALVDRVAQALKEGRLADDVWAELLDFKNTADRWLTVAKDVLGESSKTAELAKLAQQTIDLGDDLVPYVQVWLEYDVISNVEHPLASARGEPIRHVHGVEQTIGGPAARRRYQEQRKLLGAEAKAEPGPGAGIFGGLTTTNALETPRDLREVQELMVRNAQVLTEPLPELVAVYVQNYAKLSKAF